MERDFTHEAYRMLLAALQSAQYRFLTFDRIGDWRKGNSHVLLRHDVDRMPARAVALAALECERGLTTTYFFRVRRGAFDRDAVRHVHTLGHEIGYHYEELADCRGNVDRAWDLFRKNLESLRSVTPVQSIAMHGRPFSRWDSRDLWQQYDYRTVGITCEAYRDIDWSHWRYFTDTGRSWNGPVNLRDVPLAKGALSMLKVPSTETLAEFVRSEKPDVVISSHPERWAAGILGWIQVLATDSAITMAKRVLRLRRRAVAS